MLRRVLFSLMLIVLALALAGCRPEDPLCEATIYNAGDYRNACGLGVPAGAKTVELQIQVQLDEGTLAWTLLDPQGVVRWQGQAAAGEEVKLSRSFDNPAPGRWDLQFQLTQAAGAYSAPWTVQ